MEVEYLIGEGGGGSGRNVVAGGPAGVDFKDAVNGVRRIVERQLAGGLAGSRDIGSNSDDCVVADPYQVEVEFHVLHPERRVDGVARAEIEQHALAAVQLPAAGQAFGHVIAGAYDLDGKGRGSDGHLPGIGVVGFGRCGFGAGSGKQQHCRKQRNAIQESGLHAFIVAETGGFCTMRICFLAVWVV